MEQASLASFLVIRLDFLQRSQAQPSTVTPERTRKTPLGQPWLAPCEATAPAAIIRGLSAAHTGRGSGVLKQLIFMWSFQLTSYAIVAGKTVESVFPREDGHDGHLCGWSCWRCLLPARARGPCPVDATPSNAFHRSAWFRSSDSVNPSCPSASERPIHWPMIIYRES